jgi:hypothetical protein
MKQYFGVVRDHSGSMSNIAKAAMKDYNSLVEGTKTATKTNNIDTVVSTVKCGGGFQRDVVNSSIDALQLLTEYKTPGRDTPLFDSVMELIQQFKTTPDAADPEVSFLIMATTDGQDNASHMTGRNLAFKIKELQGTDRWTFVFRVPRGYARDLIQLGIEEGNILEWDQTTRGVEVASEVNLKAMNEFYSGRSRGITSSKTFYSSLKDVKPELVKAVLKDISSEVNLWPVSTKEDGEQIRTFVEGRLKGDPMLKGAAFYQLVKTEDKIQDYKLIAIRDKASNSIYCGDGARDLLGLPRVGDARVRPADHGNYDVFVQSTSVNRKVTAGTHLLYWPNVGQAFKEGISAR